MEALIEGQNHALQQVVIQTAGSLRAQMQDTGARSQTLQPSTVTAVSNAPPPVITWIWIAAGILLGVGATMTLAAVASLILIA
ncbi:MAG: hypothetical protein VBE63_19660 [Lamprobacter sp.]|uniref:hypothetical protein n=1 Tax=Lamprobacter sp. TaxID=3100796 RepID=UPI002B25E4DA|nr:hypothetical protein [Lamprobacter sp.]MEA3642135.1 hypothetical protein [Lamprobacter sp.]